MNWESLADKACQDIEISREEARWVLECPDEDILSLVNAAFRVRRKFFGKRVKLNFLANAKSGLCPEDCSYCSQSKVSKAPIDKYPVLSIKEILGAAERAVSVQAKRFCIVNSGRGPTDLEVQEVAQAVRQVRGRFPQLEICVCLGLLQAHQAQVLKESGVYAYNHNLNTSSDHYASICSTHTYDDRVKTVGVAKESGLSPCSGCLFGMGEKDSDILDLAFTLRRTGVDSIPINFLIPIGGTPLQSRSELSPQKCIKILCLFRFVNPKTEIRIAGGREVNLRWLQPLGLYAANSIFIGDYLTTQGQKPEADLSMIKDLGFEIEGQQEEKDLSGAIRPVLEEFSVRLKSSHG